MNRAAIIGVLIIVMCGVSGLAGWTLAKRAGDRGVIKQQQKDAEEVMKHEEAKEKVQEKIRTVIKTRIIKVPDPSGCLDRPSPDNYLDGLQRSDGEAKFGFNR